jgi:hypothetical protein
VKFVVDANCLISVLYDVTGRSLALSSTLNSESWLENLRVKLVEGFTSGILVATKALEEELPARSSKRDSKERSGEKFVEKLHDKNVPFLSIGPEDAGFIELINRLARKDFEDHQADVFLRAKDWQYVAIAKRLPAAVATLESQGVPYHDQKAQKIKGPVKIPYISWRLGVRAVGLYYVLQHLDRVADTGPRGAAKI